MLSTVGSTNDFITSVTTHPDYELMRLEMKKVRDCIEGEHRIKREGYEYLPHPSQVDKVSDFQVARYREYLAGAEFDPFPDSTRRALIGKMRIHDASIELPESVAYLEQDADGDGLSLRAAIEYALNNVLSMKFQALVIDYAGLGDIDLTSVSIADAQQANLRANIKQYARENVVNWHFDRVNGVMQLSWIMLLERGTQFNDESYTHDEIESYLILALDDNGEYYQQKVVFGSNTGKMEGERNYVTLNGQPLTWLPVVFIADEELPPNSIPNRLGFLHPICDLTLQKYRVSAVYKEVQRNIAPTIFTAGWKEGDIELFQRANGGRAYVATGAGMVNNMPDGVSVDVKSASMEMADFHWYLQEVDKRILSIGGASKREQVMTATEAEIYAGEQNAMLTSIADNAEDGFKRAIAYCMMFEGAVQPDDVEAILDEITVQLPRDFATPKLSVEEVGKLFEAYQLGLRTQEQIIKALAQGGWDYQDAELTIAELEVSSPAMLPSMGGA